MEDVAQVLRRIHLERRFIFWELCDTRPGALSRGAHYTEYSDNLVLIRSSREEGSSGIHLSHDTARGPYVNASVVRSATKQDVWGAIPQSDHFVGEGVDGDAKGTRETEIAKLEKAFAVNEEILRLEIPVEDSVLVTKIDTLQQLIHKALDCSRFKSTTLAICIHVSLKISIHVFKDKHELILRMNNVVQGNNILMFKLLHERNFPDRSRRSSLLGIEMDFFEGNKFSSLSISAFENLNTKPLAESCTGKLLPLRGPDPSVLSKTYSCVGAFTQLFQLLKRAGVSFAIHPGNILARGKFNGLYVIYVVEEGKHRTSDCLSLCTLVPFETGPSSIKSPGKHIRGGQSQQ